jgi:hypothetical protein
MGFREQCLFVVSTVLLLIVILLGVRDYVASAALNFLLQIRPGMSEQQVVKVVGQPDRIIKKGEPVKFEFGETPNIPVENKVYIYIRFKVQLFAVYFDRQHKVRYVIFEAT